MAEQDQKRLETFMDITGTTSDAAEQLLEAANLDLELAVNLYMEARRQNESPSNPPCLASGSSSLDYQDLTGDDEDVRAPIAPRMDLMITSDEDNFTVGRKRLAAKSVFVPLRDFSEETRLQEEQLMAVAGGSDTARSFRNKRRRLEDLFRPPMDICHIGSFQNARDAATSHNMWLLVNIQDHTEFACQVLNRDVWSSKEVKDVIKKNFVFWQVSVDSTDGARFKTFYSVYSFPYVCVIDPRTGENKTHWRNINLGFHKELERFLLLTPNPLISPTYKAPPETIVNLTEDDQIALAIKNSLQAGEDSNPSTNESSSAPDESYEDYLGNSEDDKTKISVRLPNGTKETLEWPCSSRIKALKLYIAWKYSEITKGPYKILTTFPKQDISKMDDDKKLTEANLHPTAIVHIHLDDE